MPSEINYTNRKNRRINWLIGLEYNSTLDQIKKLTDHINNYLAAVNLEAFSLQHARKK